MDTGALAQAVDHFARLTCNMGDTELERPWTGPDEHEKVRIALLQTYEELRVFAAVLTRERAVHGPERTIAEVILAQYHLSYMDLRAALIGLDSAAFDQLPAPDAWPLRKVLEHIVHGDLTLKFMLDYTLERWLKGDKQPARVPKEAWQAFDQTIMPAFKAQQTGPVADMLGFYETLHAQLLVAFAPLDDAIMEQPALLWGSTPVSLRFYFHHFDSHVREHIVHIDKTLQQLGYRPPEAQRHLRLIYGALAEVQGLLIGAWELRAAEQQRLAASIRVRADELATLPSPSPQ